MAGVSEAALPQVAEEYPGAMTTAPDRAPRQLRAGQRRKQRLMRWIVVLIVVIFMLTPLVAMLDFSTRILSGARTGRTWALLLHPSQLSDAAPGLGAGFEASLGLMVLTAAIMVVLLVPTMTWVRLRAPGVGRIIEFICLLPLVIPAIVLAVGFGPIYIKIDNGLSSGAIWLCFAYVVLVLPYAYRAIDAGLAVIDVKVLSEAARSLGSSWGGVMWRIILPNIKAAVLGACFLTVALVLGEFTVASLLLKNNLAVSIFALQLASPDPRLPVVVSLVLLVFAFLLMFVFSFVGNTRKSRQRQRGTS